MMARKPNYGYEKRQKELAKKAKKEDKKKAKIAEDENNSQEPTVEPTQESPTEN
ncbi:MAG: hypothetical protein ACSLFC_04480 [Desulfuromonadales bacterium]